MKYQASGATHTGRVRDRNEDYLLMDPEIGLYLVCDGMGGHSAGEVASEMAATTIARTLRENVELVRSYTDDPKPRTRRKLKSVIEKAVQEACQVVWKTARKDKGKQGMGTTVAMMLVCGRNAFVAHVGDSRVYMVRNQALCQLTEDHTLFNDMLRQGMVSAEQARAHPYSNALTRAIGIQPGVQIDILHVEIMLGDRYLLCSDGLSSAVPSQEILALAQRSTLTGIADALVDAANERGGRDNVTAVILALEEQAPGQHTMDHSAIVAEKIEALRRIPMFSEFDYKQLVKFVEIGDLRMVRPGEVLIREGEADASMYVILRGNAEVLRGGEVVNRLGPGDYFGEMSLIDRVPRSATVVAAQPMLFLVLERDRFFGILQTDASMATKVLWSIVQKLNRRLRQADDEVHRLKGALGTSTIPSPMTVRDDD
jgi:protein phosphatase